MCLSMVLVLQNHEQVAETFLQMKNSGKVKALGISNFRISDYEPLRDGEGGREDLTHALTGGSEVFGLWQLTGYCIMVVVVLAASLGFAPSSSSHEAQGREVVGAPDGGIGATPREDHRRHRR